MSKLTSDRIERKVGESNPFGLQVGEGGMTCVQGASKSFFRPRSFSICFAARRNEVTGHLVKNSRSLPQTCASSLPTYRAGISIVFFFFFFFKYFTYEGGKAVFFREENDRTLSLS